MNRYLLSMLPQLPQPYAEMVETAQVEYLEALEALEMMPGPLGELATTMLDAYRRVEPPKQGTKTEDSPDHPATLLPANPGGIKP